METKTDISSIINFYEMCFDTHGPCAKGVDWPDEADLQKRHDVMTQLFSHRLVNKLSVLDFGCGYGSYLHYLQEKNLLADISYTGLDISEKLINAARTLFPKERFICQDIHQNALKENYDYIVLNGVLTEKQSLSYLEMVHYAESLLFTLFQQARKGLSFNVMHDDVDYSRLDLFHWNTKDLTHFIGNQLTPRFEIRTDYLPFEKTVYLYHESE